MSLSDPEFGSIVTLSILPPMIVCVIGMSMWSQGYDPTYQPDMPSWYDRLPATVYSISQKSSDVGDSVVKFSYNRTHYDELLVDHCSVLLHNTWPNSHTADHYPIDSLHTIYETDGSCMTTESLRYFATQGFYMMTISGGVAFLSFVAACMYCCCRPPIVQPVHPPAPIVRNNENAQENDKAVAVAVPVSNHPYPLASVV
jgi:hypothetical protein